MVIPQLATWYRVFCLIVGSQLALVGTLLAAADHRTGYYAQADEEFDDKDK